MRKKTINFIIIISSVIFISISILLYLFIIPQKMYYDSNLGITQQSFVEQSFISPRIGTAKALYYFVVSASQIRDAKNYGFYLLSSTKVTSSSSSTCKHKTGSSKTPCSYYVCNNYMRYTPISSTPNSYNNCAYIKYPSSLKYSV